MPLPFFLAGLVGKVASGAVAKAWTAKASVASAKARVGVHGNHTLARKLASEVADKLSDKAVDAVLAVKEKKGKRDNE
jgi:hypothetical protein